VTYFLHKQNVLSEKQINEFNKILDNFIANKKPREENLPHLSYSVSYAHVEKKLSPILDSLLGSCEVAEVLLQRVVQPHSIHNDYRPPTNTTDREPGEPHYAVLFPLRADGLSHTIIFPEQSVNASPSEDDPVTGYEFTDEHKKLLTHAPDYSMHRVSDPQVVKWSAGDVIAWDRKNFHASDNFIEHGTSYKDSIILFTNK
jgi:hypothetical protein